MTLLRSPKSWLAIAALSTLAATAQAEGLYLGGAVGAPDYSSTINGYGTGDGGRGPAFKLFGGYQVNPYFAVEGGAFNLGRSAPTDGSARIYGAYVDAVGTLPVAPGWSLLGSAGLAQAHLTTPLGNDNSPGLKMGVALKYDLSSRTSLRLGYDRYRFTNAFDDKANVGSTTLGVQVGF